MAAPPVATAGLQANAAGALAYLAGIITGIIFLLIEPYKSDRFVRFHAFQGLYLFVAWLMEDWVFKPMLFLRVPVLHLHGLIEAVLLVMSIFMMVKASHDEAYALPVFGELAQRSIMED